MTKGLHGEPKLGKWDYDGRPFKPGRPHFKAKTFSVGIFQWIGTQPEYKRSGLWPCIKRGKVICRVRGWTSDSEVVYDVAEKMCEELDDMQGPGLAQYVSWLSGRRFTAKRRAK